MDPVPAAVASGSANGSPTPPPAQTPSHTGDFHVIDSTLRECDKFGNVRLETETKIQIATALSDFGIEYISLTSPAVSEQARIDCETIVNLGLKAKILTHVPCTLEDAKLAVATGVAGIDLVIETSSLLNSSGNDIASLTKSTLEVIEYVKSQGIQVSLSSEGSFEDLVDLVSLYKAVDAAGVERLRIADTVGNATPRQVYNFVRTLRGAVNSDLELQFNNATGCAVSNSHTALEVGATHIDVSVLGIGEQNGITPLGAFLARMIVTAPDYVKARYDLHKLKALEDLIAEKVQINVPFNNPVTGQVSFTHKAGIHAKAVLNNPSTYEVLSPGDFGLTRHVEISSRLTGWNAIKSRVEQLGLSMSDEQVKSLTTKIKDTADIRPLSSTETDALIRSFHAELQDKA